MKEQPSMDSPPTSSSVRIEMRDPADLKPLAAVKDLEQWSDEDPDFLAFCDDIKIRGILDPLLVTGKDEIVDGRHRWRAARRWQMTAVPVRVVVEHEADSLILLQLSTLCHRRHYTPGQRAFAMYPFIREAHETVKARRVENLRKPQCSPETAASGFGKIRVVGKGGETTETEAIAGTLKVSPDSLQRAALLHKTFAEHPEPRKWDADTLRKCNLNPKSRYSIEQVFRPQIMDSQKPMGLGAAVAGIGAVLAQEVVGKHGGGKPKEPDKQLKLFNDTWGTLETRYEYWADFDAEEKEQALARVKTAVGKMPDDLLAELSKQVKAELRRRLADD